jgi:hypothetical protein
MTSRCFAGIAVLLLAACGGDPGSPIPDPGAVATPPVGADPAPEASSPPSTPGAKTPTPVGLTVVVEGTGSVRSAPAGIDCPGKCTASFAPGTHVTLASVPAEGWKLQAWGGACAGSAACAIVLDKATSVTGSLALLDARWDPSVGKNDCAGAWGNAGEKLSPCDTTKDDYVVVHKSKRNVALCKNGALVKNLRSGLGDTPVGAKLKEGDGKTPEGVFYVPRLIPDSAFHKALLLSYPTPDDATRGLSTQLITSSQRAQIQSAHAACVEPPQSTALGGELEITGNGSSQDWTHGSIALDDVAVDLLWGSIGVGDSIVVVP